MIIMKVFKKVIKYKLLNFNIIKKSLVLRTTFNEQKNEIEVSLNGKAVYAKKLNHYSYIKTQPI